MLRGSVEDVYGPRQSGAVRRPTSRRRSAAVVPVLVALGLLTGTAAAHVRDRDSAGSRVREALVEEVRSRTAATDRLAREAEQLRADLTKAQSAALAADAAGRAASSALARGELAAHAVAVEGPGVEVVLDDAPGAQDDLAERGGTSSDGRVLDRDLQDAVNGLWAAGAEAIAISGQRLSSLTAIRSAGEAILVDYRSLSPPYVVRAIGDPATLEPRFVDGPVGRRLATYTSLYGIRMSVRRAERLRLPGAAPLDVFVARPKGTS